jgi:hypothetical protein
LFYRWEAPATPEGYWDLTMHTPDDWISKKKIKTADDGFVENK